MHINISFWLECDFKTSREVNYNICCCCCWCYWWPFIDDIPLKGGGSNLLHLFSSTPKRHKGSIFIRLLTVTLIWTWCFRADCHRTRTQLANYHPFITSQDFQSYRTERACDSRSCSRSFCFGLNFYFKTEVKFNVVHIAFIYRYAKNFQISLYNYSTLFLKELAKY